MSAQPKTLRKFNLKSIAINRPVEPEIESHQDNDGFIMHLKSKKKEITIDKKKFSEQDLENAKNEAYAKGLDDGLKKGIEQGQQDKIDIDKKIESLLFSANSGLIKISEEYKVNLQNRISETIKLSLDISKKVAGAALKENPEEKITEVVNECMKLIYKQNEIIIYINESVMGRLQDKIKEVAQKLDFSGKINLRSDHNLKDTDCKIEWENGSAGLNIETTWNEIEKILGVAFNKQP